MTEQQKFGNTDPMLIAKYDDELRKVQSGWRDMDSAPRDGTDALVYSIEGIELAWWADGQSAWMTRDGTYVPAEPTHWMPLPPAPTEHPTEQPDAVRDAKNGIVQAVIDADDIWSDYGSGYRIHLSFKSGAAHVVHYFNALRALKGGA